MTTTALEPTTTRDETAGDQLRAQLRQGRYRVVESLVAEAIVRRLLAARS